MLSRFIFNYMLLRMCLSEAFYYPRCLNLPPHTKVLWGNVGLGSPRWVRIMLWERRLNFYFLVSFETCPILKSKDLFQKENSGIYRVTRKLLHLIWNIIGTFVVISRHGRTRMIWKCSDFNVWKWGQWWRQETLTASATTAQTRVLFYICSVDALKIHCFSIHYSSSVCSMWNI